MKIIVLCSGFLAILYDWYICILFSLGITDPRPGHDFGKVKSYTFDYSYWSQTDVSTTFTYIFYMFNFTWGVISAACVRAALDTVPREYKYQYEYEVMNMNSYSWIPPLNSHSVKCLPLQCNSPVTSAKFNSNQVNLLELPIMHNHSFINSPYHEHAMALYGLILLFNPWSSLGKCIHLYSMVNNKYVLWGHVHE